MVSNKNFQIDIFEAGQDVSADPQDYCDLAKRQKLPFLFPGATPSERFVLDDDGRFEYYGREKFREVYEATKSMSFRGTRKYFLHGTFGAGKSHMLAALACLLNKEAFRVVYLPDCREMLGDVFVYLHSALHLTFMGSVEHLEYLSDCNTTSELLDFCLKVSSEIRLFFIIDQVNALDPTDEATDRFPPERKREVRSILDSITAMHLKLSSSSGNYQHALHDTYRQTGEKRIYLYGGLSTVCFFKRNTYNPGLTLTD